MTVILNILGGLVYISIAILIYYRHEEMTVVNWFSIISSFIILTISLRLNNQLNKK